MKSILILGGTGAIGIYVIPQLIARGFEVHATTRSNLLADAPSLRYCKGNAHDIGFLNSLFKGRTYDAVLDFMVYSTDEFETHHDFLLNQTGHYLFLSSYRVFADTGKNSITEESPRLLDICSDREYLATDEYALAKARQEDILKSSKKTNWTILRPCITYSKRRFQFGTLEADTVCYRALQGVPVIMAKDILSKETTMTWAGDVAKLMTKLVLNSKALQNDFNLVTSEHQPWNEVARIYGNCIGLKVVETDLATYEKVVGGGYQIRYDRMLDRILDNQKVTSATGMTQEEFLPLKKGLAMELNTFALKPEYSHVDYRLNARMDKATKTKISLNGLTGDERDAYLFERNRRMRVFKQIRDKILFRSRRIIGLIRRALNPIKLVT